MNSSFNFLKNILNYKENMILLFIINIKLNILNLLYSFCTLSLGFENVTIFPNSASIIFRTSNNSISFIIKSTTKYFILMTFKHLYFISSINRPNSACFITTSSYNFITLWIKLDLGNFILVTLK